MKIENQNIYGGNQQYADIIINGSNILDNTDKKLLELIHKNTSNDEERQALITSLEVIKDETATADSKKKSSFLVKKFLESSISETGKQIVQELIENGPSYIQNLF